MYKISVYVTPKRGVVDPQGAVIERALPALGFHGVSNIRVGRFITLEVEGADRRGLQEEVAAMCRQLLANPVIEDYRFDIEPAEIGPVMDSLDGPNAAPGSAGEGAR